MLNSILSKVFPTFPLFYPKLTMFYVVVVVGNVVGVIVVVVVLGKFCYPITLAANCYLLLRPRRKLQGILIQWNSFLVFFFFCSAIKLRATTELRDRKMDGWKVVNCLILKVFPLKQVQREILRISLKDWQKLFDEIFCFWIQKPRKDNKKNPKGNFYNLIFLFFLFFLFLFFFWQSRAPRTRDSNWILIKASWLTFFGLIGFEGIRWQLLAFIFCQK